MRRQIGIMSLIGAGAFSLGALAAFAMDGTPAPAPAGPAQLPAGIDAADLPPVATSTITITAAAPMMTEDGDVIALESESGTAPFGYSYVVYFPGGSSDLTAPAEDALAAIADDVTGLELSRVTLSNSGGPDARTQVVRDALIELGVPARWIGETEADPEPIGPVSMAPLNI